MQLDNLIQKIAEQLLSQKKMLATAESCTGGMIAEKLTDISGSSHWFDRAFITYSYDAKYQMLGVKPETIKTQGAVSEACVLEMVVGALENSTSQIAVAVSGIAGPTGGTPDKPVGTVWIAWAQVGVEAQAKLFNFSGGRGAVREQATQAALEGILELLTAETQR